MTGTKQHPWRGIIKGILPPKLRSWLRERVPFLTGSAPARVRWGNLRRTEPFSRHFGYDRGVPVDRLYIERFLQQHAADISGRVLEIKDSGYTNRFGGVRVHTADVLDIDRDNPHATIFADLNTDSIPAEQFDCIVFTQTLHLIYDFRAALLSLRNGLKPKGVLLLTVPGITPVSLKIRHTWYWSFTAASIERLIAETFPGCEYEIEQHGNVLAAISALEGLASHELTTAELSVADPAFPVIVTARVLKN
jgi:SAM-dependent methyltransferase